MPEQLQGRTVLSLYEIAAGIQKTVSEHFGHAMWIKAELNKLNFYRQSGHCYPELVEKKNGKVIAQIKSNLWSDDYRQINAKFIQVLNEPLKDGIKVLILATVSYHPIYGLALRIMDIDPAYTLGDLEKEKQETINRLKQEGIFDQNKSLSFPLLPKRIALISDQTSKGYADFLQVLSQANQSWGYVYNHILFPSVLQGDRAVQAMIEQLGIVRKVIQHFDVVAIVRGGGGDVGLSCYNHYDLAREIALYPIPVITGIGHATNETVSEMVASENAITPTRLAEFLIQKFHNFAVPVKEAENKIIDASRRIIANERSGFRAEVRLFFTVTRSLFSRQRIELMGAARSIRKDIRAHTRQAAFMLMQSNQRLGSGSRLLLKNQQAKLKDLDKHVQNMSPENVLKRGYSISSHNGKAICSTKGLKPGDIVQTRLYQGSLESTIKSITKPKNNG